MPSHRGQRRTVAKKRPARATPRRRAAPPGVHFETLFRLAFENTTDLMALMRVEAGGRIFTEYVNPSAIRFYSRIAPALFPDAWRDADLETLYRERAGFSEDMIERALAPHREAIRTRRPVSDTSEVETAAGEPLLRQYVMTPMLDRSGRVTHLFFRGADLTGMRQAEERFRRLFESSPTPLSMVRLRDGERLHANDAWLAFFGRTRADALGRPISVEAVWTDPDVHARMVETVRREGRAPGQLVQLRAGGGALRHALVSMEAVVWSGEDCIVIATQDVSDIEAARREAQAARLRLQSILDRAPVAISITERESGAHRYVNPAWREAFGMPGPLAAGFSSVDSRFWASPEERRRLLAPVIERGERAQLERHFRRADGRDVELLLTAQPVEFDGLPCILSVSQNVTEISQARRDSAAAAARFAKLFEVSPVPLTIVRLRDNVRLQANSAWTKFFGVPLERAIGANAGGGGSIWVDLADRARIFEELKRVGQVRDRVVRVRGADGQPRDTLISIDRITWDGEECAVTSNLDVSAIEQARRDAQLSGERFAKLFDLNPVPIVIGRRSDGAYLAANPAWLRLHGYRMEELGGQTSITLGVWPEPADRARVLEVLEREGEVRALPVRFRTKSGTTIETLYYAALIDWAGEQAIVAAPQDITELVRVRRESETQGERFKALFRLSPNPLSITTLDEGRYLAVNSAWASAMGYAPEEMLEQSAIELGVWPDAAARENFAGELRARGALRQLPVRFRTRRGEIRQMQISSELIEWQGAAAILSSMNDVTDLERAKAEALASSERFVQLFENNPVPIVITRIPDGTLLEINRAWLQLRGMTREQALGQTTLGLGSWVDRDKRDRIVADIAAGATYRNFPVQLRARGDKVLDILYSGARIDWKGEAAVVAFLVDVSDITQAGEEIRRLNESLEQKVRERTAELESANRELESFSYSVSHDLRSPLGAINGFAHVLRMQEGSRLTPDGDRLLGLLERDTERMTVLVDGLLEFSRLGRKPLAKTAVSMAALVASVVDEVRSKREAQRADFRIGALPGCNGDPVLLRQVWWNLIDNAIKYSRQRDPAVVEIGYDTTLSAYRVRDNGVGFDMAHAGQLFGVFERLHANTEFEGTGIGLANASRIILRHGGRIWCEAEPGRGATFYFTIGA